MARSYPQLLAILRAEFQGPYTAEVAAKLDARLKELEPDRELHVLTMGDKALIGISEGDAT